MLEYPSNISLSSQHHNYEDYEDSSGERSAGSPEATEGKVDEVDERDASSAANLTSNSMAIPDICVYAYASTAGSFIDQPKSDPEPSVSNVPSERSVEHSVTDCHPLCEDDSEHSEHSDHSDPPDRSANQDVETHDFGDNRSITQGYDILQGAHSAADSHMNLFNQPGIPLRATAPRIQQLQNYIRQQEQLRQVERRLRSSLNGSTILGVAVMETAALFQARQVSLLRYVDSAASVSVLAHHGMDALDNHYPSNPAVNGSSRLQRVVQYCQNQALAWQQPVSISQIEFPALMRQLLQGRPLHFCVESLTHELGLAPDQHRVSPSLMTEIRQWLAHWPGNWLLIPVLQKRSTAHLSAHSSTHSSNHSPNHSSNPSHLIHAQVNAGDSHWGVMALALSESQTWTAEAIVSAQSIAHELSFALEQAQQHQALVIANHKLQKLALSDGLTGLANRRRFDEHLADEWQRLARDQQPLSLILCDLDHFKRYNDTFGHPAGDRCLIHVAKALLNAPQRPADLVARYGGEEFAIILPNTDTHGAWRIAQKIHESIRDLKITHAPDNQEAYVTVTMGVSTVVPGHDTTAQMLVQASDLALYHAKQQGRNRTYVHAHYSTVSQDGHSTHGSQPAMTPTTES